MSDSTDIIVRLRLAGTDICLEAAREIEGLRERLDNAHATLCVIAGRLETAADKLDELEPFIVTDAPPDTPR